MTETTKELLARLRGFTPGPHYSEIDGFGSVKIEALGFDTFDGAGVIARMQSPDGMDFATVKANANLYAAAPDLHRIATKQAADIAWLRDALLTLVLMNENRAPFGGEMYPDRVDRAWNNARKALEAKP